MSLPPPGAVPAASASHAAATRQILPPQTATKRLLVVSTWALGLMWLVPFLVADKSPPIPSFQAEALAAVLGLIAMSALLGLTERLELPRATLMPLGFAVLILLQLLVGRLPYAQVGLLGVLYLLWAAGLVVLGGLLRRELGLDRVASALSWFLLTGAFASALIGWAQYVGTDVLSGLMMPRSPDRVWANLGQPNQLADYLTLGLIGAGYLYAQDRLPLVWTVVAVSVLVFVLSLAASRASWFYWIGLLTLSAVFCGQDRSRANRRLLAYSAAVLVLLALLAWLIEPTGPATLVRHAPWERVTSTMITTDLRFRIWKAALLMFLDSPLLGIGFKSYGWHQFLLNKQAPEVALSTFTDHAHNLVLQVLAEFGLVGLAILVGLGALWVAGLVRQPRTPSHWWIWAITLVLAVHSMLEYPLWYTFFLGVAAVVLGLGEGRTIRLRLGQGGRAGRLLLGGLLSLGWLATIELYRDYAVVEGFVTFRYRYFHAPPDVVLRANQALAGIPRSSLLTPYVEMALARAISIDRERLTDKLIVNSRAMRVFPIEDVVFRQAMLLALSGEQRAAERQWDLAVASYPDERSTVVLLLQRRIDDGIAELRPLLEYARKSTRTVGAGSGHE